MLDKRETMALPGTNQENQFERLGKKPGVPEVMTVRYAHVLRGIHHAGNSATIVNALQHKAEKEYHAHVAEIAMQAQAADTHEFVLPPDAPTEEVAPPMAAAPDAQSLDLQSIRTQLNNIPR